MSKMSHDIFKEPRIVIKFLVKLGKTGAEIMPILNNVCGKVAMKKSAVYDWIQHFQEGWEDVNNNPGCGWHIETRTPSNVECMKQLLYSDHCLSNRDVTDELSINCETIHLIMKDKLRLWNPCAKLVPTNLTRGTEETSSWCLLWLAWSNWVRKHFQTCDNLQQVVAFQVWSRD